MSRTYDDLVTLVRRWANRDIEVLPDTIVADCIRYAADKSYRHLRIAPLEHTITYTAEALNAATANSNNRFSSVTELQIPADLIEFIQIREIDDTGRTTRIFNEKADLRTFNDLYAEKYNDFAFWSRQGNCILLSPGFGNTGQNFGSTGVGNSTGLELHYYRRLPAQYARYQPTLSNARDNLLSYATSQQICRPMYQRYRYTERAASGLTEIPSAMFYTSNPGIVDPDAMNGLIIDFPAGTTISDEEDATHTNVVFGYGSPVPNWLRDENERILLMGALAEVFFYLQEDDQAQKYTALFQQEIQELNNEDVMRNASGGNVQMNFNGRGLI